MAAPTYQFEQEIPVQGDGGWDYLSVDRPGHRLYLSHGDQVVVIDLKINKVVGSIASTPGVHGFALAPELGRGFSSNGKEGAVSIVDLKTLKTIAKTNTGENPDAILYVPDHQEVYAFNGKSQSATVIDGKSGKVVATIPLTGKPEFAAVDPDAHRVYVNIEDKDLVTVIDSEAHKAIANWPLKFGKEPTGLSIDTDHHRLFVGCHNKILLMMDSHDGHILDHAAIGAGVDSTWYDSGTNLAFSSNGEGTVSIFQVTDKLNPVQTLVTKPRARTMALDSISHHIYLPTAEFQSRAPGNERGQSVPGTFKVLAYTLKK